MKKFSDYRPAMAAFLMMAAMAITTTGLSFFVGPVCDELGFGRGSFTACYSILTAAGTLASPFLGQAIQRRGVQAVIAVSAFWTAMGLLVFSFCFSLWMFYLTAAFTGFFGTACVTLCASVTVQTGYRGTTASRLTGLVMAGSGLGGMVVSFLLPGLIGNLGWRWGYRIAALGWLVLCLCSVLLLRGELNPHSEQSRQEGGMTRSEALHSVKLYLLIPVIYLLSAASGVQQQLPAVLSDMGMETARVSLGMSVFTMTLALGKIIQGMLYGKAGPKIGGVVMVVCYAVGFLLLGHSYILPGLMMLALGMGTVTTLMPIAARAVFGSREYASIWSILSAVSNLGAMTAAPLFGMAYDLSGSYAAAMTTAAVLLVPALAGFTAVFRE